MVNVLTIVSDVLSKELFIEAPLTEIASVSGGCINEVYRVSNQTDTFFVKVNSAAKYPSMFQKEVAGLELLRAAQTFKIPKVVALWEEQEHAFLVLEWMEKGVPNKNFWANFAVSLAQLHQNTNPNFGLSHHNYIGSLEQQNTFCTEWHHFFFEYRLLPQLSLGIQQGWTQPTIFKNAENIAKAVESDFPREKPALLHGDLWSGNYLVHAQGQAVLIDPAVYFGNREMEIAFMQLFGGFDQSIYSIYHNFYPLAFEFQKRLEILQLYPILVHANLFGGHYISQALAVLKKF
jgi:fructosamine-3-kinase